ncbi:MAG TPA: alpha/beta hydrolase domain-containing protein, partial [Gammaproteobacteria bacterium]|nr:alpha/beta hydrolase domain-containing protein [Gammaproteobacteria bacterium]
MIKLSTAATFAACVSMGLSLCGGAAAQGNSRGGPRVPAIDGLPTAPTAVALPTLSAEITGPGPMFDSAPSQARGLDTAHFGYATREYFASGTAAGKPYTTRVVVRMPRDASKFSGLVLAESMHSSGAAHMFEFTSGYLMSAGHAAVEILTTSPAQFTALNAKRYEKLAIADGQQNEIIAQVASLIRAKSPLTGGAAVRKLVMSGTSMSAGTLINYLPAHLVYRTPEMQRIFDGFMPTSNGSTIMEIDVPLIQLPTMHEVENNVPRRQDSDEPGKQYRLFEFAGVGHVDSRDNARLIPNPCVKPLSTVPLQAYYSVGLYHLLRWVDQGIAPPHAARVLLDRDTTNDESMMALDAHGN